MKHYTDDNLIDYIHNEVTDAVDAEIHAHLGMCRDCRDRYDAEASIGEMLRSSPLAQEREFPSIIKAHVWASIRSAEPTLIERIRAFISPALAVPLAVAVAVLLYIGVPVFRGTGATAPPTVAAAYYFEEHAAGGLENPLADHVNTNATLALGQAAAGTNAPLIDVADAATLDHVAALPQ